MNGADKELPGGSTAEAAEDSALTEAEQERFRRMMDSAEEKIAELDKWLTESGLIKKQPEEVPEEAPEQAPEEVSEGALGEEKQVRPEAPESPPAPVIAGRPQREGGKAAHTDDKQANVGAGASWQLMLGFGVSFAVRVGFLGIWLGSYIDRRWLGDTGFGAMAIIVLVIFYSFYMLYRDLMRAAKRDGGEKQK